MGGITEYRCYVFFLFGDFLTLADIKFLCSFQSSGATLVDLLMEVKNTGCIASWTAEVTKADPKGREEGAYRSGGDTKRGGSNSRQKRH